MNRNFHFPRATIALMLVVLSTIFVAIEKARDVQVRYSGSSDWPRVPAAFVTVLVLTVLVGAAAYGIMFALRRSGVHRLSDMEVSRRR